MKKALSLLLSAVLVLSAASVAAFAADSFSLDKAYDSDGYYSEDVGESGNGDITVSGSFAIDGTLAVSIPDRVAPGSTFYIPLFEDPTDNVGGVVYEDITNTDYFKFKLDKDTNSKLISSITVVTDKRLAGSARTSYLKVVLNDMTDTDEMKTDGTITFKAKADLSSYSGKSSKPSSYVDDSTDTWESGDTVTIDYTFCGSNEKATNDDNPDVGDRVYMDPDANATNTLIWGDDRAALKFDADDDASKFYARLSTSNMSDVYAEYGDPVDADLWFYNFVGSPTVPATSKATLTLGIPWDDDDDYTPDPESCYIYTLDSDGYLTDVTASFTYSEDDQEIPGWSIRTRQLGTYIVSDTELDVYASDGGDVEDVEDDATADSTVSDGKDIPNTGSSDMVNVAVLAAVLSLSAAGAVAFRKAAK